MWRAEAKENIKLKDAFVRVDFALSPEKGSDIKCRAELPLPEKWDGRLWGQGNSGRAGFLPSLKGYVADGTAGVTTDLGTSSVAAKGALATDNVWPAAEKVRPADCSLSRTLCERRLRQVGDPAVEARRPTHRWRQSGHENGNGALSFRFF